MTGWNKGINFIVVLLILVIMSVSVASAIQGRILGARMILYPEVNGKDTVTIQKSILVKNVNDIAVNITLRVDPESEKMIELVDESFILEPNTEKDAYFIVKAKEKGTFENQIVIFFKPVEGKEAGVALPATVIVVAKEEGDYEDPAEEQEETEETQDNPENVLTGGVTGVKEGIKVDTGMIVLVATSVLLIVVLVLLMLMMNRNKGKSNGKKNGGKK